MNVRERIFIIVIIMLALMLVADVATKRHEPPGRSSIFTAPPSRLCMLFEDGWKRGDIAHAQALIRAAETRRLIGHANLILRNAKVIEEGNIRAALEAAEAWARAGVRYLDIAKADSLNGDEHTRRSATCARNAVDCATWARKWAEEQTAQLVKPKRSRGGLTLLALEPPPGPEGSSE